MLVPLPVFRVYFEKERKIDRNGCFAFFVKNVRKRLDWQEISRSSLPRERKHKYYKGLACFLFSVPTTACGKVSFIPQDVSDSHGTTLLPSRDSDSENALKQTASGGE